jgi:hypothetical protein
MFLMKTTLFLRRLAVVAAAFLAASSGFAQIINSFSDNNTQGEFGKVGDMVTIMGSGFYNSETVTAVTFNGVPAFFKVLGDSQLDAQVPSGATTGQISMTIQTASGSFPIYSSDSFTVVGNGPYISGFTPVLGSAGQEVEIDGYQFTGVTNVSFNGVAASPSSIYISSDTILRAVAPAGVSTGPIRVTSPNGSFVTSSNFYVPPVITGFSPAVGRAGTNVVIAGTSLTGVSAVRFNGIMAAYTVNSDSSITAVVPSGAAAGLVSISAPAGGYVTSSNFLLLPTILGFTPGGGPAGTLVKISGLNFGTGSITVKFNTASTTVAVNTGGTNLSVYVPNQASTGPISVVNNVGTSVTPNSFYLPPDLFSIFPYGGPPGTQVAVTGQGFTGATSVKFGALPAAGFVVNSDTAITAVAPPGVITGPVVVANAFGATSADPDFFGPPYVSSFSPGFGAAGGAVTFIGTNFLGDIGVSFGGVVAVATNTANNDQFTIAIPKGVLSGPLVVTTYGGSFTNAAPFYGAGSISDFYPAQGFPGASVTIEGANFLGVSAVAFGSTPASFAYVDNVTLNVTVPPGAASGVISVTTPAGTFATASPYTVSPPALGVASLPAGMVRVSWPLGYSYLSLQSAPALGPGAGWTNSAAPVSPQGNENVVTVPASGAAQYYRLTK